MDQTLRTIYVNGYSTYSLKENIRFELAHGEHSDDYEKKIENGKKRAFALFNDVFKDTETIQLLFFQFRHAKKNDINNFLYDNAYKVIDYFSIPSSSLHYESLDTVLVIETAKSNVRTTKIIDGLCYKDFYNAEKLRIHNHVIFYHARHHTILNIYDDRGCDIWSDDVKKSKKIYTTYNDWILDYDRKSIDSFYESII